MDIINNCSHEGKLKPPERNCNSDIAFTAFSNVDLFFDISLIHSLSISDS